MEENLSEIKEKCPWLILLHQSIPWNKIQDKAQIAALLTSTCSPAGWNTGPANLKSNIIQKINLKEYEDSKPIEIKTNELKQFVPEFYEIAFKQLHAKIISIPNNLLKEINEFVIQRGHSNKQGWTKDELLTILNHNISILQTDWNINPLPSSSELSLELLYGIMLSIYKQEFITICPQIAILGVVLPFIFAAKESKSEMNQDKNYAQDKIIRLKQKCEKMNNWKNSLQFDENTNSDQFVAQLQEIVNKKLVGHSTLKKFKRLIWLFQTVYETKQDKFQTRKMIKEACYDIGRDYQDEPTLEEKFFAGITYCLNRLPTDISVFNNNTLRNPKLHFAYPFLIQRCPAITQKTNTKLKHLQYNMQHLVKLIKKAKEYKYYLSDWQNNLARAWNKKKNELIIFSQWIQKQKDLQKEFKFEQKIQIPPPLQYDLALDLNPEQHPFSFCYGNSSGYCINYKEALGVFISKDNYNGVNVSEKNYFYYLLSNPPEKINYLLEIPEKIRKEKNEEQLISMLDKWLEENQTSITCQKIKEFIDYKINKLPNFIQKKLNKPALKYYSTISLFHSIFFHYPSEQVYEDNIELPIPQIDLELKQTLNDELQADENVQLGGFGGNAKKKWFCWGFKNYGGF